MKKIFFFLTMTALLVSSCGGNGSNTESDIPSKIDHKMFTDEAEVKKVATILLEKAGENISKLDKLEAHISRPSVEGVVKRDKPDYISMEVTYLDPSNPKKLYENKFYDGKWTGESRAIQLIGGGSKAENFVLADQMYDASAVTADMITEAVKEAWEKYKDEEKYSDQWIRTFAVEKGVITVDIKGILSANDLEKTEYFKKKIK